MDRAPTVKISQTAVVFTLREITIFQTLNTASLAVMAFFGALWLPVGVVELEIGTRF